MTRKEMEMRLAKLKVRENNLVENGKNVKSPGALHKIRRQIRNLEAELATEQEIEIENLKKS